MLEEYDFFILFYKYLRFHTVFITECVFLNKFIGVI